jgi:NitT/TauT family transport system ATP-binding protein
MDALTSKQTARGAAVISMSDVGKSYFHRTQRREVVAVEHVSLDLADRELVCLLGPSGCGKSTLLNLVAGFEPPTTGTIRMDGSAISGPGPERGVVFQEHGLFPWLTVRENVLFGPKARHRAVPPDAVEELLGLVGLATFTSAFPHELSGGMRQRAALARVLINQPRILLMDEPFGALDALTRVRMQQLLLDVMDTRPVTTLFITHDVDEAVLLGDRVLVMTPNPGRVVREFVVDLERPRTRETTNSPEFVRLRAEIMDIVMA